MIVCLIRNMKKPDNNANTRIAILKVATFAANDNSNLFISLMKTFTRGSYGTNRVFTGSPRWLCSMSKIKPVICGASIAK